MSEAKPALPEKINLDTLKLIHDIYATTIQTLTQRVQWFAEEFEFTEKMIAFHRQHLAHYKAEIEKLEPSKPKEEKQGPMVVDATPAKADAVVQ